MEETLIVSVCRLNSQPHSPEESPDWMPADDGDNQLATVYSADGRVSDREESRMIRIRRDGSEVGADNERRALWLFLPDPRLSNLRVYVVPSMEKVTALRNVTFFTTARRF